MSKKYIPKKRTFGEKEYTLYKRYRHPGDANQVKGVFRTLGHLARIVEVDGYFCVYFLKTLEK